MPASLARRQPPGPRAVLAAGAAPRSVEIQASALRQTRRRHLLETAEDYVEAIAELLDTVGEARAVDLARRLGVSHVTVSRTVSRLQRDGYVSARPYRAMFLTEKGADLARTARARHELVVAHLRSLGVPERVAQRDAEGIEHHVSAETLAAFRRHIGARRQEVREGLADPRRVSR
jgi:DtxR family manganese transport transcriptional regulator